MQAGKLPVAFFMTFAFDFENADVGFLCQDLQGFVVVSGSEQDFDELAADDFAHGLAVQPPVEGDDAAEG